MKKIALATIFYQNAAELQRLADSIPPKVIDYWIAIDGPFRYNVEKDPNISPKSDDGSLMVLSNSAHKFNDNVIIHYKAGATEYEKRNLYLENCEKLKDISVLIIVDSDEYFTYPIGGSKPVECWNRFKKNIEIDMIQNYTHNVYGINYIDEAGTETYKPRVWTNPASMRYINGSHYHYANIKTEKQDIDNFLKYRQTYCQHCAKIIRGGVTLSHDHKLRSAEYQRRREEYQRYLVRFEELVQSTKFTIEEAHKMAKETPSSDFQPT
ncbi:MAG TPA: hypothetical protein VFG90_04635 [Nitrososphaeraceae archaeon]|nr:hypothetical protein [Nitrososphaeraceae archaeon]